VLPEIVPSILVAKSGALIWHACVGKESTTIVIVVDLIYNVILNHVML
jgi:hypothetical protein